MSEITSRVVDNLCLHCLEEGSWEDEDKCPSCNEKGHVSPWRPSKCAICNKDFFDTMNRLKDQIYKRSRI